MSKMTFLNYNIENLAPKLNDLGFVNYVKKFDFVCLTETFMDASYDVSGIFRDYLKFYCPAVKLSKHGRNSGGVMVLVKKCYEDSVHQIRINCDNSVAIRIEKCVLGTTKDVLFIACYIPPEGSPAYDNKPIKDGIHNLEEAVLQGFDNKNVYLWLAGDFNARTGSEQAECGVLNGSGEVWGKEENDLSYLRRSHDEGKNNFGRSLIDFCQLFDLTIVNGYCDGDKEGEFTYVSQSGSSVIDYFLIPRELLKNVSLHVNDSLYSWHLPVEFEWSKTGVNECSRQRETMHREEKIVWSDEKSKVFRSELESDLFTASLDKAKDALDDNLENSVNLFVNAFCGAAACMVMRDRKNVKRQNDWFDMECDSKKREVKRLLKRYQRCKTKSDQSKKRMEYVAARNEYNLLRKNKMKEFTESRIKKLKDAVTDSKSFWGIIRSINRKEFIYNDITVEEWHDHFYSVFNDTGEVNREEEEAEELNDEIEDTMLSSSISREEVLAGIKHLKNGKSAGADKITGEMLKNANKQVIDYLVKLFNTIFDSGTFPSTWAKSIIIPIFKKGDPNIPDNYRGIALTSILSKVYIFILNDRLTKWSKKEQVIVEEQAGFRSGYSTIDHIFTLYAIVQKYLMRNTKLFVAFVDFRKAFDSVDRNALWDVLRRGGVNGKLYRALKGIYSSVLACVRVNGAYSNSFKCPRGVKQGCLISPQLFSFFINELAIEVAQKGRHGIQLIAGATELFLLLFADDVILLSGTVNGLQNQLNCLKLEADRLALEVNLDKTNIIVFRMGGHLGLYEQWYYGTRMIKVTNTYKYLGLIFSTKLSLSYAWEDSCKKGKKGVIEILKTFKRLEATDFNLFLKLFDMQIAPMLTYAAEIWGLDSNANIEKVQTYALKRFLAVPIHSSNTLLYGETGRYPLFINTSVKCIKYWLKLVRLPNSRLCKQAYDMMCIQMNLGKENWVYQVKQTLCKQGFGIVWLHQGVGSDKQFISEFKDRIISNFQQDWHAKMEDHERYNWFFAFKSVFQVEKYILSLDDKWMRSCMLRFRLRTLGFNAHKLWFQISSYSDEHCPVCKNAVEDEKHFLFECKAYELVREKYNIAFRSHLYKREDVAELLRCENENVIKSTALYIAEEFKIRASNIM